MAVNVHIAPSKGMTLPFISYGGSSMIALAMGFGLLLAFSRRNPHLHGSPYVVTWRGSNDDVAPLCPRRGRDRRPYGPGPRARRGIAAARAPRRLDHRRSRRAHSGPVRQCPGPCPARRAAGRRAGRLVQGGKEHHDRPGDGAQALRDLPALGGDRLRRLSGLSGACSRRGATASRPCSTSRMPCSAGSTG